MTNLIDGHESMPSYNHTRGIHLGLGAGGMERMIEYISGDLLIFAIHTLLEVTDHFQKSILECLFYWEFTRVLTYISCFS